MTTTPRALDADHAVDVFKALADPVRFDLLTRIAGVEEMACTRLTDESSVSASTVSYHVKALKAAGLVAVRKEGRNFHYTARTERLAELESFLHDVGRRPTTG